MLDDMTHFDDHSPSARLLRLSAWLCIFAATAVFWVAVGMLVLYLLT